MTDPVELLRGWPSWSKAGAATVLASPAWRMQVEYDGQAAVLLPGEVGGGTDELLLDVAFDDEPCRLGIGDFAQFADLHLLWQKRSALPREVLLALVERECGAFLQMLEDSARKRLSVKGVSGSTTRPDGSRVFRLRLGSGDELTFSLETSPMLELALGGVENIDVSHEQIRSLERPAEMEYALLSIEEKDLDQVASGDFILLPEEAASPSWQIGCAAPGQVSVRGVDAGTLTFAQMADGDLPPIPQISDGMRLKVMLGPRVVAVGVCSRVGQAVGVRIEGR